MLKIIVSSLFYLSLFLIGRPVEATQSWSAPETFGKNLRYLSGANVAIDANGNAVALFPCYTKKGEVRVVWLEASSKPVNGTWSTPVRLTPKREDIDGKGIFPIVCIDNRGNAVAVWRFPHGGNEIIQTARLPHGSSQWIVEQVALASGIDLLDGPYLQMDQQGRALATWGYAREGKTVIESARLSSSQSQWNLLTPLEFPDLFDWMQMNVNPAGTVWLIWTKGVSFINGQNVTVSTLSPDSNIWSAPETIVEQNGNITFDCPQIVSDLQGNVLATWQECNQQYLVFVAYQRLQGSTEWKKIDFPKVKTDYFSPGWLSLDQEGNALFVWSTLDQQLLNSRLALGQSSWSAPEVISEDISYWSAAIDSKGNRLLSWINEGFIKSSTLPFGQNAWTAPFIITKAESLEACDFSTMGAAVILFCNPEETLDVVSGNLF
ncbi:MAG: hypothetical protein LLG04_10410 [Parachlamydia sp.]|nr:hypothetical protein [Parachlamydia sp.]